MEWVSLVLGALVLAAAQQAPVRTVPVAPLAGAQAAQAAPTKPYYDEGADATVLIAAAQKQAGIENRRLLLEWGANDNEDCRLFHQATSKDRDVAKTLQYEYDVVRIDVGRSARNEALAKQYGADLKTMGLPAFTILDAGGKVLANQAVAPFRSEMAGAPGFDPKRVNAFLVSRQAEPLIADTLFKEALARAKREQKRVFLRFGAPW